MNDVTKLPKWVQDKIQVLEMRVEEMTKRARAYEEKTPTPVYVRNLSPLPDEKPLYLPADKAIRFLVGKGDWEYIDVRLRRTAEQKEAFVELMAGGDLHLAPEVRNVLKVFVK
jgi:hypothetical protein